MKIKNKKEKWDGKSRIPTEVYRKNFNEIFGVKEKTEKRTEKRTENEKLNSENSERFVKYEA
tara:strand:+ start:259 stop:444 length:186 start_codon:yes stop_codon:yes gene_type:complete